MILFYYNWSRWQYEHIFFNFCCCWGWNQRCYGMILLIVTSIHHASANVCMITDKKNHIVNIKISKKLW